MCKVSLRKGLKLDVKSTPYGICEQAVIRFSHEWRQSQHNQVLYVTSGCRRKVDEICALLGYYAGERRSLKKSFVKQLE